MEKTLSGNAYLATMIGLASSAFGMVAALAWNEAIKELFNQLLPGATRIFGLFVEAIIITAIAVFVMVTLGRAAQRIGGSPVSPAK